MPALLRQLLKNFLPQSWIRILRLFKEFGANLKFLRRSNRVQAASTAFWVTLKESICIKRKLDYPGGGVVMDVGSRMELIRLNSCRKEPETVNWIESRIKPGDVFYDIGANVGAYSFVVWASTGGNCTVYAFEPGFYNFASLSRNIFLNKSGNKITAFQCALAGKTGILTFNYSDIRAGYAKHKLEEFLQESNQSPLYSFAQPIISYRLDDFINQFKISLPNHIKIDVDGAELNVLEGAKKTLLQPTVRSILVEIDESQPSFKGILNILEGAGFRVTEKHKRSKRIENLFNYIFEK